MLTWHEESNFSLSRERRHQVAASVFAGLAGFGLVGNVIMSARVMIIDSRDANTDLPWDWRFTLLLMGAIGAAYYVLREIRHQRRRYEQARQRPMVESSATEDTSWWYSSRVGLRYFNAGVFSVYWGRGFRNIIKYICGQDVLGPKLEVPLILGLAGLAIYNYYYNHAIKIHNDPEVLHRYPRLSQVQIHYNWLKIALVVLQGILLVGWGLGAAWLAKCYELGHVSQTPTATQQMGLFIASITTALAYGIVAIWHERKAQRQAAYLAQLATDTLHQRTSSLNMAIHAASHNRYWSSVDQLQGVGLSCFEAGLGFAGIVDAVARTLGWSGILTHPLLYSLVFFMGVILQFTSLSIDQARGHTFTLLAERLAKAPEEETQMPRLESPAPSGYAHLLTPYDAATVRVRSRGHTTVGFMPLRSVEAAPQSEPGPQVLTHSP